MNFIDAIILSIVEGVTEFLPISSTGHMILVSKWMRLEETQFLKAFEVIIQFGAILSVLVLYRKKFFKSISFYKRLFIAFLPTGILGFTLKTLVQDWLGSVIIVACSLIIGGIVLLGIDRYFEKNPRNNKTESDLNTYDLISIGLFQSLAMIPGVSRSASTILGGLLRGLSKKEALEFSFFLAVPTMAAATLYQLYKIRSELAGAQLDILLVGFVGSFIVATIAIKGFLRVVLNSGFKWFGIYRILLGIIVLFLN